MFNIAGAGAGAPAATTAELQQCWDRQHAPLVNERSVLNHIRAVKNTRKRPRA